MTVLTIVLLSLIISVIYANFKPEKLPAYEVATVAKGDLQTTFDTQGIVSSDNTKILKAAAGVKVLTVDVAVGDRVEPGQVLATFDVSSLTPQIEAYKKAAAKATESYEKALATNQNAKEKLAENAKESQNLQKQIATLQADIKEQEQALEDAKKTPPATEDDVKALLLKLQTMTPEEKEELSQKLQAQKENIPSVLSNNIAVKKMELSSAETKLSTLQAQKPLYEAQLDETMTNLYKSVMDQKVKERDDYLALVAELKKGWVAESDSLVTTVQLVAGEPFVPAIAEANMDMTKLLDLASGNADAVAVLSDIFSTTEGKDKTIGTGMVLECYGDFYADFTVGKYDLQNLRVGQKATVLSLGETYEAEVTYVSAVANAQAGFDISSIASSITGGSSSSTNSAPVRVKIANPDQKIVIGFDVDVQIDTEKLENILKIPVEAVTTADGENCVFIYNAEKGIAEKRMVVLGAGTDTEYEVLEGLSLDEQIVLNPKTVLADGDKIEIKE